MAKIDLKQELKQLYRPSARAVSVVDVLSFNFLMVDGQSHAAMILARRKFTTGR